MEGHHPTDRHSRRERKTVFADERWKDHIFTIPYDTKEHNAISGNTIKRTEKKHED